MKERTKTALKTVAKVGIFSAIKSCGSASRWCLHQPKEPASLKALKK